MDGRGAWRDNVSVESLWRSVKYERVYLKAYDSVSSARAPTLPTTWIGATHIEVISAWSDSRPMRNTSLTCRT